MREDKPHFEKAMNHMGVIHEWNAPDHRCEFSNNDP